jgi:hypothetical protein
MMSSGTDEWPTTSESARERSPFRLSAWLSTVTQLTGLVGPKNLRMRAPPVLC